MVFNPVIDIWVWSACLASSLRYMFTGERANITSDNFYLNHIQLLDDAFVNSIPHDVNTDMDSEAERTKRKRIYSLLERRCLVWMRYNS